MKKRKGKTTPKKKIGRAKVSWTTVNSMQEIGIKKMKKRVKVKKNKRIYLIYYLI